MIESVNSIYRPLFTVKFIHNGYETPMDKFFSQAVTITTDEDTGNLFKNYKMNYRFFNDTLICFIQCTSFNPPAPEPKLPSVKIDGDIRIRFLIKNNNDFFSKTFATAAGNKKKYQFSNKANNLNGPDIFLSAPVENYSSAKDYTLGSVVQNAGSLFGANKIVLAADSIPLTNADFWAKKTPVDQVVSNADLQDATLVNVGDPCFGVIDLYNTGTMNSSYNLFDTGEKLFNPAPVFTIKFMSKS
jgi:hypothetical protein